MGSLRRERKVPDLPSWVGDVDHHEVQISKVSLRRALDQRYGKDIKAKFDSLQRLKKRVEEGLETLTPVQAVALTEVLSDLVLNRKIKEANPEEG